MKDWTEEQKAAWRQGTWTPEQIKVLAKKFDNHVDNCDDCLDAGPGFCPIGTSLLKEETQASLEYSWQPNFDPLWYTIK